MARLLQFGDDSGFFLGADFGVELGNSGFTGNGPDDTLGVPGEHQGNDPCHLEILNRISCLRPEHVHHLEPGHQPPLRTFRRRKPDLGPAAGQASVRHRDACGFNQRRLAQQVASAVDFPLNPLPDQIPKIRNRQFVDPLFPRRVSQGGRDRVVAPGLQGRCVSENPGFSER